MSVFAQDETYPYPFNQSYVQFTNSPYDLPKEVRKETYSKDEINEILKETVDEIMAAIVDIKPTTVTTIEFSELPVPSEDNKGSIYNIVEPFISDDRFIDGANKRYPAGCNAIVVQNSAGEYKFDVFAGEIQEATESDITDIIDDLYKD